MSLPTVVIPKAPPTGHAPGKVPLYRTMGYTLDISARYLLADMMGKGTVPIADSLLRGYADRIFRAGNASLTAYGRENIEPGRAYVYMSNHRSLLDIPTIFAAVPGSVRMVFKQELLRVPVWGKALVSSGFIPIDRKNTAKAIQQLENAKERLRQGVSVWVAPEGTRSRDGRLATFKKGGFHLARQLGASIVPVWLQGTSDIIPPDNFVAIYDGDAVVRFGAPVDASTFEEIPALMDRVRARMLALAHEAGEELDSLQSGARVPARRAREPVRRSASREGAGGDRAQGL